MNLTVTINIRENVLPGNGAFNCTGHFPGQPELADPGRPDETTIPI